jgi:pimeloyl-ACP methyl ester carboxylesterase
MDPLNIEEMGWALEGEEALVPELEREAAKTLENVERDPAKMLGDEWGLSDSDRAELARPERHHVIRSAVREAFRTGIWGWVDDDLCITAPWGFDVGEIRVPTQVVYGLTDVLVPPAHGEWLARHVPGAETVAHETLGHLPSSDLIAEIVTWLVQGRG